MATRYHCNECGNCGATDVIEIDGAVNCERCGEEAIQDEVCVCGHAHSGDVCDDCPCSIHRVAA